MTTAPGHKRQRGLALKMGVWIVTGTAVVFSTVLAYNYICARRMLLRITRQNASNMALSTVNKIDAVMGSIEAAPLYLARILDTGKPPEPELLDLARNAVAANPEVAGTMVAFAPYAYDPAREFYGPYFFRDRDEIKLMWLGGAAYPYYDMDWYLIPRELGRPAWTDPYYDEGGINRLLTTFACPFYTSTGGVRAFAGVVTADVGLEWLYDLVSSVRVLESGYAFLLAQNGAFVTHPKKEWVMRKTIFDQAEELDDAALRELGRDMIRGGQGFGKFFCPHLQERCMLFYTPMSVTGWSLAVVFPEHELYAELSSLARRAGGMALLGLGGLLALTVYLVRRMIRPIHWIAGLADSIAGGDLATVLRRLPAFEKDAEALTTREYSRLAFAFIGMAKALNHLIGQVRSAGVQVTHTSAEIAASARQLEATAVEQAASTQEVAATSQRISARSQSLAGAMDEVADVAGKTTELAKQGWTGLQRMEAGIQALVDSTSAISARLSAVLEKAGSIGSMVTTIGKVADQTNLLSLNAGIEAEKAGEYGLGFSVVAREIRRLADQTEAATQDIRRMVKDMHDAVSSGVREMDAFIERVRQNGIEIRGIGGQLGEIMAQVRQLTPRFEEINADMREQSRGAEQISATMSELTRAASQIRNSLQEFNKVSQHLNDASQDLSREVAHFKVED